MLKYIALLYVYILYIYLYHIDDVGATESIAKSLETAYFLRNSSPAKSLKQKNNIFNRIFKKSNVSYLLIPALLAIVYVIAKCIKSLKTSKTRRLTDETNVECGNPDEKVDVEAAIPVEESKESPKKPCCTKKKAGILALKTGSITLMIIALIMTLYMPYSASGRVDGSAMEGFDIFLTIASLAMAGTLLAFHLKTFGPAKTCCGIPCKGCKKKKSEEEVETTYVALTDQDFQTDIDNAVTKQE